MANRAIVTLACPHSLYQFFVSPDTVDIPLVS